MSRVYRDDLSRFEQGIYDERLYADGFRGVAGEHKDPYVYGPYASHVGNPTTVIQPTANDERNIKHVQKRLEFLLKHGLGDYKYAMSGYPPAAEDRVESQIKAYAHHGYKLVRGSIPASSIDDVVVDESKVPGWVYFPAKESEGKYHFKKNFELWATDMDAALESVGLLSRSPSRARSRSPSRGGKKSHKKKSGRKTGRKTYKRRH
jgi:hypothetical protein